MPPITSPRRTAFTHGAPPHAHPGARPIPSAGSASGSSASASSSPQRHAASAAAAAAHASLAAVAAAAASVSSSPSTGTSPNGLSTSPRNNSAYPHPHASPYMVALAGWPEPVFVAEARDMWEKRKSRPGSPTGRMAPFGAMEVRDGMALPPPLAALDPSSGPYRGAAASNMSRSGSTHDPLHRSRAGSPSAAPSPGRHASSPAFPTSSARDNPSSPPLLGETATPPPAPAEGEPLGPPPVPAHVRGGLDASRPRRLVGGFTDPRYGLNAAAVGRTANRAALRVAPAWHSAGSSSHATPPYAGTHGPVGPGAGRGAATAHRTRTPGTMSPPAVPGHATSALRTQRAGAAAHRANPEVYPPPQAAAAPAPSAPAPHMATAVYPRDPDSPFMWQGLSAPPSANASSAPSPANGSDGGSPTVKDEEHMDVDDR